VSNSKAARHHPATPPNPLFLRDEELIQGLELLDFAYQSLAADRERLLVGRGIGQNHHRLLHFIGRRPDITMAELLTLVPLSKQSQSRLLKELQMQGLITQTQGRNDRRQRLLRLTQAGAELEQETGERLRRRLAVAYRAAGAEAVAGYHQVLEGLLDEPARRHVGRVS
jgi:DNA-binding MarR family transcriptional regulator